MHHRLRRLSQRATQHLHQLVSDLQGAEEAQAWRTLGDVRTALVIGQPRNLMTVLLHLILHILPQPWQVQVLLQQAPPSPWECAALPGVGFWPLGGVSGQPPILGSPFWSAAPHLCRG
jgi:hypothetical protein